MIEVVGRLPVKTLAVTSSSLTPSARTSSAVLPKRQGLGLGEEVGEEKGSWTSDPVLGRVGRGGDGDEVARDDLVP